MLRLKSYLTAGLVAAGIALASAGETIAKPPGGSRPGGGGGGARPSGGSRPSGGGRPASAPSNVRPAASQPQVQQYRSQNYRDYDRNYRDYDRNRTSIGIGGFSIGIGAYPGYGYQRGYYSPGYGSTYVERYVEPPVYAEESQPAPVYVEPSERRAETYLRILLPDPNGSVWVDGLELTTSGKSRMWGFPDEGANRQYVHKVKASFVRDGQMVTEEREVRVTGNTTAVVDFTRPIAPESETPMTPTEENP